MGFLDSGSEFLGEVSARTGVESLSSSVWGGGWSVLVGGCD